MASEREDFMAVDTPSMFAQVIQEHLELKRRNAALEHEMPLERYLTEDPFQNHPLFKTEEQARIEDTMDGVQGIEAEETSLDWPTTEDTFIDAPALPAPVEATQETVRADAVEPDEVSDENLWSRSRDFDWGD
jgi:hypothetical protein